jgi:glycosyltransferase involved in cell wall biosynthesis
MKNIKKKNVLFVCHDASRTGAPIVLLHFLRWLKKSDKFDFSVLIKNTGNGDLIDEFEALATVYKVFYYGAKRRILNEYFNKVIANHNSTKSNYSIPKSIFKKKFDLIYINTVDGLDLAAELKKKFNCPVICHIHENEFTIKYFYPESLSDRNKNLVDHYIAVSESTRSNLITKYKISPDQISLIYAFIPIIDIKLATLNKEVIKKELNLTDQFIIGGSGLTIWRKGIDLFVQLAVEVNKLQVNNNIKFLWVGSLTEEFKHQWLYECNRLNIEDKIIFCGKKDHPQNYFQIFDLFTLTSREDPFPLVALEAASMRKPILYFADSGGIPELIVNNVCGVSVPYSDVHQMAKEIINLKENNERRMQMGNNSAAIISNYDVNIAGNLIVNVIQNHL